MLKYALISLIVAVAVGLFLHHRLDYEEFTSVCVAAVIWAGSMLIRIASAPPAV